MCSIRARFSLPGPGGVGVRSAPVVFAAASPTMGAAYGPGVPAFNANHDFGTCPSCPNNPEAVRNYDGIEFRVTYLSEHFTKYLSCMPPFCFYTFCPLSLCLDFSLTTAREKTSIEITGLIIRLPSFIPQVPRRLACREYLTIMLLSLMATTALLPK